MNSATQKIVRGTDDLTAALRALSDDMRDRTLAAGVSEAVKPILVAARRYARRSRDTGALEESLTTKVVNYPRTGKAVGLVGPDRAYFARGRKVKGALSRAFTLNQRQPAKYAHLIEYGHVAVAPRKGKTVRKGTATVVGWVPARPFIRPAVVTTAAAQEEAFYRGLERGWTQAVNKEVARGRHVRG